MKKLAFIVVPILALFAIAATSLRFPIYTAAPVQILYGTAIMTSDGSVTQSFTTQFGSVPKVYPIQQNNAAASTTNFVTPTVSNAILRTSIAGSTQQWIAIGAP
jgi:hypothetical protein